jgi:ubiquinone/menaquinone biosynthesis C-methylase UbiE
MTAENFDIYEGLSWSQRAQYGTMGVALDCADTLGKKNAFIDAIHKMALASALRRLAKRFARALDFGCGGGRLLPLLALFAAETYGVDRTPECIELARTARVASEDHLLLWRDGPLPFDDGWFDLVLSAYVLLRTAVLDACLPELARLTSPGGNVILIEQLDNGRGLTAERYHEAFARNGLRVLDERLLRCSSSRWMRLASSPRFPASLARLAARTEMATARRAPFNAATRGYYDCLFLLAREGQT